MVDKVENPVEKAMKTMVANLPEKQENHWQNGKLTSTHKRLPSLAMP